VVDAFCADPKPLLAGLHGDDLWDVALAAEPGERRVLAGADFVGLMQRLGMTPGA
jgi:hypothetical protein